MHGCVNDSQSIRRRRRLFKGIPCSGFISLVLLVFLVLDALIEQLLEGIGHLRGSQSFDKFITKRN